MELTEKYKQELLNSIPVVAAMKVEINDIGDNCLVVGAPLNTNINYEGTAFGGSLNTLCILSCYLLVHHQLKSNNIKFDSLVIQNSNIDYILPVHNDFKAKASVTESSKALLFKMVNRKGMGRVEVSSKIMIDNSENEFVTFKARFVVKRDL